MPYLTKRWISFFVGSAVLGVIFISLVGWGNNQEGNKVRNKLDSFGADSNLIPIWTNVNEVLVTDVQVNSFDPNSKTGPAIGAKLLFFPFQVNELTLPIQIFVAQINALNYTTNGLPPQAISIDASGNPNSYPFDSYQGEIDINEAVANGSDLPLTAYVEGSIQGFVYSTHFNGSADGTNVSIILNIQRNTITRLFAAIIFLLMWCLSLSIFVAAMSVWFRGKNTELPLVAISTALLFALPNIRNSQPGVPTPVGTTEDMVGFFWNMLLVGISAISLLVKWILQNKRPPPPTSTTDLEKSKTTK